MSGPTTRVLALLELLQSHGRLSGAELAEALDVDRRTVRRYIRVLEDLGIPVTTEQGRHGGYMLVAGFKLPPMMFTEEETVAIALGLQAAGQLGLAEAAPAIAGLRAKLERVMPAHLQRRLQAVAETIRLLLPRLKPMADPKALPALNRALQDERRVSFLYQSPEHGPMRRQIDPYGLVFRQGQWYVSGWCHLRQALRLFRLDRLSAVKVLPQGFTRPADFDAAEHFTHSLMTMPRAIPVRVLLHTDQDGASEAFGFDLCAADLVEAHPEGLLLNTRTDNLDWFAWWLSQLPFGFRIEEPPALKQALRAQVERLLAACEPCKE